MLTAANNKSVKVDGIKLVTYSLRGIKKQIPTPYIRTLDYDCIFGMDSLKEFDIQVDFGTGVCSLPGRVLETGFPRVSRGHGIPDHGFHLR